MFQLVVEDTTSMCDTEEETVAIETKGAAARRAGSANERSLKTELNSAESTLSLRALGRGGEGQAAPVLRNRNAPPSTLNGYAEISLA
jgi:hypothetical protein